MGPVFLYHHYSFNHLINTEMKKLILLFTLPLLFTMAHAQKANDLNARITAIEDRIALKNLVDTFSILADQKETQIQSLLFTENATVESRVGSQPGMTLTGRKQIGDAFGAFLSNFETVYHINGQQTVTLQGDKATGISYCQVTMIGQMDGKRYKTTMGVFYNDEYVKQNNRWLIAKRTSNFTWQERQEMGQ
jgi:hypothetical protein